MWDWGAAASQELTTGLLHACACWPSGPLGVGKELAGQQCRRISSPSPSPEHLRPGADGLVASASTARILAAERLKSGCWP